MMIRQYERIRAIWSGSLRLRVTVGLSAVILLVMGVGAGSMIFEQDRLLRHAAAERARAVGRTFAAVGATALADNLFRLQESLQQHFEDDAFLEIDIVDLDNIVVAAKHPARIGATLSDPEWLAALNAAGEVITESRAADGRSVLNIVEPLPGPRQIAARVRMVVSLAEAEEEVLTTTRRALLLTVALMLVGVYATRAALRRVSSALRRIVTQLHAPLGLLAPGAGGEPERLALESSSPLNQDDFEHLVHLAATTVSVLTAQSKSIRELAQNLEDKVAARTSDLVTAREKAIRSLEALRDSESRLRSIVDTAADGILVIDGEGTIQSANPSADHMFGYGPGELVGRDIRVVLPRQFHHKFRGNQSDADPLPPSQTVGTSRETVGQHKDGSLIAVEVSVSETVLGGSLHYTVILHDITERKQGEAARAQSEQQLRLMMEEREQLSRDLYEGMLQSLFAVGIGLETAKVLLEKSPAEASRQISHALGQLGSLVQEFREFIPRLWPKAGEPDGIAESLRALAHSSGTWPSAPFRVEVDTQTARRLSKDQEIHLLYITREALTNSFRHARATSGEIRLSSDKDGIRLEIKDDGVGFDPAILQMTEGMGHRKMAAHADKLGGKLAIESAPGQGTCVRIALPDRSRPLTSAHPWSPTA
jgi:PAS domain S-box-containing protein